MSKLKKVLELRPSTLLKSWTITALLNVCAIVLIFLSQSFLGYGHPLGAICMYVWIGTFIIFVGLTIIAITWLTWKK